MAENILIGLAGIIVIGIGAQWLAWRLRLPAIMILLVFGFLAGPVTGFINPEKLLGDLLLPIVSISVAIILFEGGLTLKIGDLRVVGREVRNLITTGALITWGISAVAAHFIVGLDLALAILLGAILVVTGPTVIGPLLRQVRPIRPVAAILRWEGIVIDPIGAMLAVLVFGAIIAGETGDATGILIIGVLKTVLIGGAIGLLGAGLIVLMLKHYWIPDFLQNPLALIIVVSAHITSNLFQSDSGLLAVTVMGIVLANQKFVTIKHLVEFKENLRVLLLSGLFIILAARLQLIQLNQMLSLNSLIFLATIIFVARPLAVIVSTLGSGLNWRERLFISCIAPRGVVAAAVASVFALALVGVGTPQATLLVPLTFLVIIGSVTFCGITAFALARWLRVAQPYPQGILIAGAHPWTHTLALALQEYGFRVVLVDNNWENITAARLAGLFTYYGSILAGDIKDKIDLDGIGRMLALTSNDEVNALACLHFADSFGRSEVYQLFSKDMTEGRQETVSHHQRGRLLFGSGITYSMLYGRFALGATIKKTTLTEEFDYKDYVAVHGVMAIPLFLINPPDELIIITKDNPPRARSGQTLISLAIPPVENNKLSENNSKK